MKLLDVKTVSAKTTLGRSTLYAYVKAGSFPSPVVMGKRKVRWVESDVDAWISKTSNRPMATEGMAGMDLTLRDYFAAKAMQGIMADPDRVLNSEGVALAAYRVADAMLTERAK